MMRKRIRRGGTLLLGFAVLLSAMFLPQVYAAEAIDPAAECSIGFSIAGTYEDLSNTEVQVDLYKVADVSASGKYTAVSGYEGLGLEEISDTTTAQEWEEKALKAAETAQAQGKETAQVTVAGGVGSVSGLKTGMYLIQAETAQTENYEYTFTPYLVSLPNNYYYENGNDTWVYTLTDLALKPEQTERLGSLEIVKTLDGKGISMGEAATFIFQVDYTTPRGEDKTELVTVTFGAGDGSTGSASVDEIPAGSQVTVTEIYSGASYELAASEGTEAVIAAGETAQARFTNTYNGSWNGGYGVVNSYTVDENGQYQWSQQSLSGE